MTIACITTKELVGKDFATEPDESRVRKAAALMVSNLAGSLALVTCKEPLRVSIAKHLRALLQQQPGGHLNGSEQHDQHARAGALQQLEEQVHARRELQRAGERSGDEGAVRGKERRDRLQR